MKESVLDVLMYLFETYIGDEMEPEPDRNILRDELERAGFNNRTIEHALEWLDGLELENGDDHVEPHDRSIRVFNRREQARLDIECRGYIIYLEQIGILSASQRELVLDRIWALGARDIDIEDIKWVVLMVLFTQPGQEAAYARMEDLVFEDRTGVVH
jgi:Smg protein